MNFQRKLEKLQNYIKKVGFWPNLVEICGFYGDVKNEGHVTDLSKFSRRMHEQILKVSAP